MTYGEKFSPGETKELEMVFLTPEAGRLFRAVPKFYLWEGRIIGEAQPVLSGKLREGGGCYDRQDKTGLEARQLVVWRNDQI